MPRCGVGRTLLVLGLASVGLGGSPASGVAATPDTVFLAGDGGYGIVEAPHLITSDRGAITLHGSRERVRVLASDDRARTTITVGVPRGRQLAVGVYDHTTDDVWSTGDAPLLDVVGEGGACSDASGRFEIQDLAFDGAGAPTRLRMVFEVVCGNGAAAVLGEVRAGLTDDAGMTAVPSLVRWPLLQPGAEGAVVPVEVRAGEAMDVAGASVIGPDARVMPIRLDECSGRRLTPAVACKVWVRFSPTTPGTRTAVLRVAAADGRRVDVRLQGFAHGGRTGLDVRTTPQTVPGGSWSFTPATSRFSVSGTRHQVALRVSGSRDGTWEALFAPAPGDILVPQRYADAAAFRDPGLRPGLQVNAGFPCWKLTGEFTVTEATFMGDGSLRTFRADFAQRCLADYPGLTTGTVEYRAGDTTPLPPWALEVGTVGPATPAVPASGPDPAPAPPGTTAPPPATAPPAPAAPATPNTPAAAPDPGTPSPAAPSPPADGQRPSLPATPAEPKPQSTPAPTAPKAAAPTPCAAGPWRQLTRRADRFAGTSATDRIRGGGGADVLRMGGGADCADGGAGADRIDGGAGADRIDGGAGADVLTGGTGADVLAGGPGDDTLDGGPGRDRLDCGAGRGDSARVGPGDTVRGCERVTRVRTR